MRGNRYLLFVKDDFLFRLVNFAVTLTDFLLVLRFFSKLFGANMSTPVVIWLYQGTSGLLFPFRAIFSPVELPQGGVIEWSILVAMLAYSVLGYLLGELLALFMDRTETTKEIVVGDELDDLSE